MKRQFTEEQLSAIETRDRTLLVSAAAGSGKTATMTERIIRSITDKEHPIPVSSMLICTFTNDAVNELRTRVDAALREALASEPDDPHLLSSLFALPDAHIQTIDAFCNDVVRSNAVALGIDPNFRIADQAETHILLHSVMNGLIDSIYEGDEPEIASPDEFAAFADCLTTAKRSDALSGIFEELCETVKNLENGVDSLTPLIDLYDPARFTSIGETRFGVFMRESTQKMLAHYAAALSVLIPELDDGDKNDRKIADDLRTDVALLRTLLATEDFDALADGMRHFSLCTIRAPKSEAGKLAQELLKQLKDDGKKLTQKYFTLGKDEWKPLFTALHCNFSIFARFLAAFDRALLAEKKRHGVLDFNDVAHFAHDCLWQNGVRTDCAKSLADRFDAIYVDEFQDVNRLQNSLFEAIARPDNRFMVGDIKQSIYRFRGAEPDVFAQTKAAFTPLQNAQGNEPATIFLSKNFRSDSGVIDFSNEVFGGVFGRIGETIGYDAASDDLRCGKLGGNDTPACKPEVHVFCAPAGDDGKAIKIGVEASRRAEAAAIADKILALMADPTANHGKPYRYSDFAILLRAVRGKAAIYASELKKRGIPVRLDEEKRFFLFPEILLALSILNAIDNPHRDVYLAGAMLSPCFGFTATDLTHIRAAGEGSLFDSLTAYRAAHPENRKVAEFLDLLAEMRLYAESCRVEQLLTRIFDRTGLLAIAAQNGGKENLLLLYEYARSFSASAYSGLHSFISYINALTEEDQKVDVNREAAEDAVRILSVHKSKGLEYEVCFFADAGAGFFGNTKKPVISFVPDFGIAMRLRDPSGLALVNNPLHNCVIDYDHALELEEIYRVLYVAFTRARARLYIYGSVKKTEEKYDFSRTLRQVFVSEYAVRSFDNCLEMIEATANRYIAVSTLDKPEVSEEGDSSTPETPPPPDENLTAELCARFAFAYPDELLTRLPEKLSVSRIDPAFLDERAVALSLPPEEIGDEPTAEPRPTVPAFLSGVRSDESALAGIATHRFLQFCDLERLAANGAESERDALLRDDFLSPKDAARVRLSEIEKFTRSPLFAQMRAAKRLYRELRFNVELPASLISEEEATRASLDSSAEKILVQGVIDCLIENPDGTLSLIDYKTDRLTRAELKDPALAKARLTEAHAAQLSYYARAVREMFGVLPATTAVYSMALGDTVPVLDGVDLT